MKNLFKDLILRQTRNLIFIGFCFFLNSAKAQDKVLIPFDFYAESYTSPLQNNFVHFQRLRLNTEDFTHAKNSKWATHFFVGIENTNDLNNNNLVPELGSLFSFYNLQILASYRREYANKPEMADHSLRLGLTYGDFWSLPIQNTFFEHYSEAFEVASQKNQSYLVYSTWLKLGYRLIPFSHLSFDPVVLGYRFYDSTDILQSGSDYRMGQLGFQANYFAHSQLSASLGLFKAWTESRQNENVNKTNLWALFTIGVSYK